MNVSVAQSKPRKSAAIHNRGLPCRTPLRRIRRGSVLHESTMAIAITTLVLIGVAHLLTIVAQHRRVIQQRNLAWNEAANLMEEVLSRPWSDFSQQTIAVELSAELRDLLPNAKLQVELQPDESNETARQVHVTLQWDNSAGQSPAPVHLVAWRFQGEMVQP